MPGHCRQPGVSTINWRHAPKHEHTQLLLCRHFLLASNPTVGTDPGLLHLADRGAAGLQHLFAASTAMFCWTAIEIFKEKSPALCNAICKFLQQNLVASSVKTVALEETDTEDVSLVEKAITDLDIHNWLCQELQSTSGNMQVCICVHDNCPQLASSCQGRSPSMCAVHCC